MNTRHIHLCRCAALFACLALPALHLARAGDQEAVVSTLSASGPFQPTEESLKQYRCPDWFRDAKLGIWAVWGPESVPMQGDWYARKMYLPDDSTQKFHLANYGHPSKVGFKDIIPLWKAEKWDPDHLMSLYQKAGAKYFCMIAEHHDNFDCWNSKFQRWNSVNMGPKRDIAGDWQQAARKCGLRFGMTEHLAASWWFYSAAKGADKSGPLAGVPYDGADPRYADLYWTGNEHPQENFYCPHAPTAVKQAWFDRIGDMIDRYHPDLLYSDSPLPYPDEFGRKLVAHYYNDSRQQHSGKLEAVYNCKQDSQGMWVQDLKRGVMDKVSPLPWQTDTCIGDWYYDLNLAKAHRYKSATLILQMLADIVSKNGNLLLNFPPRPDGTLDDDELKILDGMAAWMPDQRRSDLRHAPLEGLRRKRGHDPRRDVQRGPPALHGQRYPLYDQGRNALRPAACLAGGRQDRGQVAGQAGRPDIEREPPGARRQARLEPNRAGPARHAAGKEAVRARFRLEDRRQPSQAGRLSSRHRRVRRRGGSLGIANAGADIGWRVVGPHRHTPPAGIGPVALGGAIGG